VQQAIERYDKDGLDATVAHYNNSDSISEHGIFLILLDADNITLTHPTQPQIVGSDFVAVGVSRQGIRIGELAVNSATEEGGWIQFEAELANARGSGFSQRHMLSVKHDNLIFIAGFFASE